MSLITHAATPEYFKTNSATPSKELETKIMQYCDELNGVFVRKIVVVGHADTRASEKYNLKLSQKRAEAVKKLLVTKCGLKEEVIEAVGFGEFKPISSSHLENRRVELFIDKTQVFYQEVAMPQPQIIPETPAPHSHILSAVFAYVLELDRIYHSKTEAYAIIRRNMNLGLMYQYRPQNDLWLGAMVLLEGSFMFTIGTGF
ncbi:MAG: OmpA family protein [Bacteroidia bacterium]|nr:OmpA family protein [Bacteroidia bacterium]